jgi:hypothetical protein
MPNQIGNITFYSVLELSNSIEITPLTLRKYINEGKLQGRKVGGKYLVTEESLNIFLNGEGESIKKESN